MNKKILPTIFLATSLGACSMAPTYERPAAPVPAAWPTELKQGQAIMPGEWKNYFPDPRLQALISTALENNRDLRIATARIAEAQAQYGIQRADRLPTLNLNATGNDALTPAVVSSTGANLISRRNDLNVSIVSYELDFWGRVANLSAAAKANYLATEEAQRAFRFSLIADVANAYLSLEELRERTTLADSTVKGRSETRDMVARRRELGASSDMDYLQADGSYQASLADFASLQQQQTAAANLLDTLLGKPQSEIKDLPEGRSLAEQGISPASIAGVPSEVLLRRPDVQAAEQQLIAANANIGAARAAYFPRIALTASTGTASNDLNGLFNTANRAWSFQPVISMPLFDTGRVSDGVDLAKARKEIAVAQYEKTIQQAFREVADLLSASDKITEQLTAQAANAASQKQLLKMAEARYQAGIASHLDVLDAQRSAYAAEQGEVQVRRIWLSAATQLYKALAGESSNDTSATAQETPGK